MLLTWRRSRMSLKTASCWEPSSSMEMSSRCVHHEFLFYWLMSRVHPTAGIVHSWLQLKHHISLCRIKVKLRPQKMHSWCASSPLGIKLFLTGVGRVAWMGLLKEVVGIRRLRVFKYLKSFPRTDKDTRDELWRYIAFTCWCYEPCRHAPIFLVFLTAAAPEKQ